MGLLLQIIGIIVLIICLIVGIMALNNSISIYVVLILLFLASGLIKIGRKIYNKSSESK